uniref:Uncharacterized protein n=1 Tax=Globodera rostochiensis TaxID=31243 RepID=A0A914GRX4_GLORO
MHRRLAINLLDFFAPAVTFMAFVLLVFLISFLFVNFFLITEEDDLTVFEKFGARHFGVRLGPHSLAQIKSGGPSVAAGQNAAPQMEKTEKKGPHRF